MSRLQPISTFNLNNDHTADHVITPEEVQTLLAYIKVIKAPGLDGIPN